MEFKNIQYSIILSIESEDYMPIAPDDSWKITEREEDYEDIKGLNHIKCLKILTQEEFDDFTDIIRYECETMGSIGALGFGMSWTPALCFIGDIGSFEGYESLNAYVTPFIENEDFDWDELLDYVREKYSE